MKDTAWIMVPLITMHRDPDDPLPAGDGMQLVYTRPSTECVFRLSISRIMLYLYIWCI